MVHTTSFTPPDPLALSGVSRACGRGSLPIGNGRGQARYAGEMKVRAIDHLVLCVADVAATRSFYERVLGMESRQALHFGDNKISLQDARAAPSIARDTVPGSGIFCVPGRPSDARGHRPPRARRR